MKIQSVYDPAFAAYGRVLEGYDLSGLLEALARQEKPSTGTVYRPSCPELEALPVFDQLRDRQYGGMPIQIGYCNGFNTRLNCLEYHRDSEVNVTVDDMVLLLGKREQLRDWTLDTAQVEAFLLPAGGAVELYATALHYAPCDGRRGGGFQVAILLPRGTNTEKPEFTPVCPEDSLMTARNKWLLAHPDSDEARGGARVGLTGANLDIAADLR